MRKVIKEIIPNWESAALNLCKGAKFLSFQYQVDVFVAWFVVEDTNPMEVHRFYTIQTGDLIPDSARYYLGAAQTKDGVYVLHLFTSSESLKG